LPTQIVLNLGGEGEQNVVGEEVINQQPHWAVNYPHLGTNLAPLIVGGESFLFCRNTHLPFPDNSVDRVFSNSVPVDINTWLGPGVQTIEVQRILRPLGQWRHNGIVVFTKP
jgi:hypothetical protein